MEFIILVVAIMAIFLPLIYIFAFSGQETVGGISAAKIDELAVKLTSEAREIYYRGQYNKVVLTVNLPSGIYEMGSIMVWNTTFSENSILVKYRISGKEYSSMFRSEVPIMTMNPDTHIDLCDSAPSHLNCTFYPLSPSDYSEGSKNYQLSTVVDLNGRLVVNISRVDI